MVSTRNTCRGKKLKLPTGRDLPSELHYYAPRKFGDWEASYKDYYVPKPPKNEGLARLARRSAKMGYVKFLLELQHRNRE